MIQRILLLLEEQHMTAKELTDILAINKSSVSEWKSGKIKPSIDVLVRISRIFSVSLDWLLTGEGARDSNSGTTERMTAMQNSHTVGELSSEEKLLVENYRDMTEKDKIELQRKIAHRLSDIEKTKPSISQNTGDVEASRELGVG